MNLGGFGSAAGGFVQAAQAQQSLNQGQQRINQNQQQLDQTNAIQQGQLAINQQDAANRQNLDDRQNAARKETNDLLTGVYGPQQVQSGTQQVDDGNGGTKTVPVMKTVQVNPGQDPVRDSQAFMSMAQIAAKYSGMTPADFAAISDRVESIRRTDNGKKIDALLAGDQSQLPAVAGIFGKDPNGAKLDIDPLHNRFQILYGDGTTTDLSRMAHAVANTDLVNSMRQQAGDAQSVAKTSADIDNTNAEAADRRSQSTYRNLTAGPDAAMLTARANNLNAHAALAGKTGAAMDDSRAATALVKEISPYVGTTVDQTSGKSVPDVLNRSYLAGRSTALMQENGMKLPAAVARANAEYKEVATNVDSALARLKPADLKAKFGTSDTSLIRERAIQDGLKGNSIGQVQTGNLITQPYVPEE